MFFMTTHARTNCLRTCSLNKAQRRLPPYSAKTLQHPSFMSLYTTPGPRRPHHGDTQTVHPMTPLELFYTDPTHTCGTRIVNHAVELRNFDCFQLNTPPPIMSAFQAPPLGPDPFRTGQHFIRNLGSPSWEMSPKLPPVNTVCTTHIVQLTREEDQAITHLLTLHHGGGTLPTQRSQVKGALVDPVKCPIPYCRLEDQATGHQSREADFGKREKHWSDAELEAAYTLTQFKNNQADFSTCSSVLPSEKKQNMTYRKDLSPKKELSESEGDALCGLLSLGLTQTVAFQQ